MLPRRFAAFAIAALALAFALPAPADQFAWVCRGARSPPPSLQGLAVLHALSRGCRCARCCSSRSISAAPCAPAGRCPPSPSSASSKASRLFARAPRPRAVRKSEHHHQSNKGENNGSHFVGARRQARPHGRHGARQGRLRPQFPAAARQGAARDRGEQEEVREPARRPRGAQSASSSATAADQSSEARRQELHHHPPGRRDRPALRLGLGARHRRGDHRGGFADSSQPGRRCCSRSRPSACTRRRSILHPEVEAT